MQRCFIEKKNLVIQHRKYKNFSNEVSMHKLDSTLFEVAFGAYQKNCGQQTLFFYLVLANLHTTYKK